MLIYEPKRASSMLRNIASTSLYDRSFEGGGAKGVLGWGGGPPLISIIGGLGGGAFETSSPEGGPAQPLTIDISTQNGPKHAEEPTESIWKRQLPQALKSQLS